MTSDEASIQGIRNGFTEGREKALRALSSSELAAEKLREQERQVGRAMLVLMDLRKRLVNTREGITRISLPLLRACSEQSAGAAAVVAEVSTGTNNPAAAEVPGHYTAAKMHAQKGIEAAGPPIGHIDNALAGLAGVIGELYLAVGDSSGGIGEPWTEATQASDAIRAGNQKTKDYLAQL